MSQGAGYVDGHSKSAYVDMRKGYIATIPDDFSYVSRMQRGMVASPLEIKAREIPIKMESSKPDYMQLNYR